MALVAEPAVDESADAVGRPQRKRGNRARGAGLILAIIVFWIFLASPVRVLSDSTWVTATARSFVSHRDVNLDEYRSLRNRPDELQLELMRGETYYEVPLATSLFSLPVVGTASIVDPAGLDRALEDGKPGPYDAVSAALLSTLAVLVMYAIALRATRRVGVAFVAGVIFAFGTQAWSIASRTMWMHTPSILCLTLALYCALRAREDSRWALWMGSVLALAYFVRPTNAVVVLCFAVWTATLGVRAVRSLAVGGIAVAVPMVALNIWLYGRVLQPYFNGQRLALSGTTVEALVGNLVSPSRGLLWYVPVVLLSAYGVVLKRRASTWTSLDTCLLATIVGYWVAVSCLPHWWAGWTYGPRFLTDVAPFLVWFLIPVVVAVADRVRAEPVSRLVVLFVAIVAASVFAQASGALVWSTTSWNWSPADVDKQPSRLWDWSDPQLLR